MFDDSDLTPIQNAQNYTEMYAEIVGVTEYSVDGAHYVTLTFLSHSVDPYADASGMPSKSLINLKRVGSVTMTHTRALALRDSLIKNLGDKPNGVETRR